MAIDTAQFLQTFYEESFEGLDVMESSLLGLDSGAADLETINTIFRAAHSIKGGSATFGLSRVASFTHLLETLLDEMRDGRRQVTQTAVDLLLACVDCLRDMLAALQHGADTEPPELASLQNRLETLMAGESIASAAVLAEPSSPPTAAGSWKIRFQPHAHLFHTGNDPLRIFRELAQLGELTVCADLSGLPPLDSLDPENCHLAWDLQLVGNIPRSAVDEAFAWVDGDCELAISALPAQAQPVVPAEPTGPQLLPPVTERRKADRRSAPGGQDANSIRVGIDKVDAVINLVGELVITQSMLSTLGENFDVAQLHHLQAGLAQLERNTRELQESVMRMRMLPISFLFNRFPRMVHDVSAQVGKLVALELLGEATELDKTVMEKLGDPLVHLVRNALDHGIEDPGARAASGKNETGTLRLNAYHKGGNIVIQISDDGAGLDRDRILAKAKEKGLTQDGQALSDAEIFEFIFQPGFSTAQAVSDLSGRGVGMDVVRRNIKALGGSVDIASQRGKGTTFTVRLPLTLSILDGQLIRAGDNTYVIPLVSIIESLQVRGDRISAIAGKAELYKLRDDYIPIIRLYELFGIQPSNTQLDGALMVVVEGDGRKVGLLVDDLLGQQQVVLKSLESNFQRVEGVSGATILGDGTVALIIDTAGLIQHFRHSGNRLSGNYAASTDSATAA